MIGIRKIFAAAAIAAFGILSGCTEEKQDPEKPLSSDAITLSMNTVSVPEDGGKAEVTVTSSGDWRMTGGADWSVPSCAEGHDGDVITFEIAPNDTDADREVKYKIFTGSAVAELTIRNVAGYVMSLVSDKENDMSVDGGTVYVRLSTNIPAEELDLAYSENGEQWITCEKRTDVFGTAVLTLNVAANPYYEVRSSVLTISGHDLSSDISFSQGQTDYLSVSGAEEPKSFSDAPAEFDLTVSYNVEYEISGLPEWISWTRNNTVEDAENPGLSIDYITFNVEASDTPMRNATFTISDPAGTASFTVSVSQLREGIQTGIIPDRNMRQALADKKWIELIDPTNNSTEVIIKSEEEIREIDKYYYYIFNVSSADCSSIEGVEYFTWVTNINLYGNPNLKEADLSGLHNVTVVQPMNCNNIERIDCGDNSCTISLGGSYSSKLLTITGTNVSAITGNDPYASGPASFDITGCPNMKTINLTGRSGINAIYLTSSQKESVIITPDTIECIVKDN